MNYQYVGRGSMARYRATAKPQKRGGYWYLVRRVPTAFHRFDKRGIVFLSTGINIMDDPRGICARLEVDRLDSLLLGYWQDKKLGLDVEWANLRSEAHAHASRFLDANIFGAQSGLSLANEALLRRLSAVNFQNAIEPTVQNGVSVQCAIEPALKLSDLADDFERLKAPSLMKKSVRQRKKWLVERGSALRALIAAVGKDKEIGKLTRSDALSLRSYYQTKIVSGEVEIGTANKYIGRISAMIKQIDKIRQLGVAEIFSGLRFDGAEQRRRVAFPSEFVMNQFLAEDMFAELNCEARRIVYLLIETGMRLSEACNLTVDTIKLDTQVPHVQVRANSRELKTAQSERDIPLVGVALKVMKLHRAGFPRYRDRADSLSALVNKALNSRALRPEPGQSLYSLRHTFEDRLTAVEAPEKVVACLMGHKWHRPRYGSGPSLQQKQQWLNRIVFPSPVNV